MYCNVIWSGVHRALETLLYSSVEVWQQRFFCFYWVILLCFSWGVCVNMANGAGICGVSVRASPSFHGVWLGGVG